MSEEEKEGPISITLSITRNDSDLFLDGNKVDNKLDILKSVKKFIGIQKQYKKYDARLKGFTDVVMFSVMATQERHIKDGRDCNVDNCFIHLIAERYNIKKNEDTDEFSIIDIEKAITNEIELELI